MIFLGSSGLALISFLFDILFFKKLLINTSPKIALIIGIPAQTIMIIFIMKFLVFNYVTTLPWVYDGTVSSLESPEIVFVVVHSIVAVGLSKILIEIDCKLGPGNLWKMLSGRFFKAL